jgi:hypothetical protein
MTGKTKVKKVVLDVLKPLEPSLVEFAKELNGLSSIKRVDLLVLEIDRRTETVKATVEGADIDLETLRKEIEKMGGTIHSVDQVLTEKD